MNVLFFPANKLGASICPIFNGRSAIVSLNTDRLIDKKHELAEIGLFKHNLQATSFLNPLGVAQAENANYAQLLKDVRSTGRISFGLYYRTDFWVNPVTEKQELIPDYNGTVWTAAGAAAFANAVVGQAKASKTPNHGQQMYDISNGALGYDFVSQKYGASGGSETRMHTALQRSYFKELADVNISSGSYANGAQGGAKLHIPTMLGLRNSVHSVNGAGDIKYTDMTRAEMVSKASTTRTWDAVNAGQFATQAASLTYTKTEVQRAIAAGGWFSDFMHWHSLYDAADTAFFDSYFSAINEAIGSADVWRAGNNEVFEYYALKAGIDKIGSFISGGAAYVFVRFSDAFRNSNTDGISDAIDPSLINTGLSVQIDFTGTALAGKTLTSGHASTCRSLGSNKWIFNVKPSDTYKNGYMTFKITETSDTSKTFNAAVPVLTATTAGVTSTLNCKFVVWRKGASEADTAYRAVHRTADYQAALNYAFDTVNYKYVIGGITRSRISSTTSI